ncbi:MAG: bifunctional diaminohydroxyphosphoribosylaminopyrimidine deaminase/5-amino-6-(5-phosphoribosylamino)uracil reductase RibD [Nodosilinea sp. LVE1205-7]
MGRTAPNPMVGAVVVKQGEIVGEGFHPGLGLPHAEVFALQEAGERARGATLYVNLEPCNHTGRTPPCTEAIIGSGIRRVVAGMVDPDPRVSGGGIERLRAAGIEVIVGVAERACQRLNEGFLQRVTRHRPLGVLKYAMTLDGKIATQAGQSRWITGPTARAEVHRLRAHCDAVVVGGNTVRCDNPHLTTHGYSGPNPKRVVLSRQLDLPDQAHLWATEIAPTLVFTTPAAAENQVQRLRDLGVEVITLDPLTPAQVTDYLYQQGCAMVLWECGGNLAAQAIADRVIDKLWAFIAPKLIGGNQAPTPIGDLGITHMAQAIDLTALTYRSLGEDYLIEAYLNYPPSPSN